MHNANMPASRRMCEQRINAQLGPVFQTVIQNEMKLETNPAEILGAGATIALDMITELARSLSPPEDMPDQRNQFLEGLNADLVQALTHNLATLRAPAQQPATAETTPANDTAKSVTDLDQVREAFGDPAKMNGATTDDVAQ